MFALTFLCIFKNDFSWSYRNFDLSCSLICYKPLQVNMFLSFCNYQSILFNKEYSLKVLENLN